ncbi:MAG: caspase family protein [Bacteroidetes bacterium]|nr:caspase family protein [Bacteroidota bacterium]
MKAKYIIIACIVFSFIWAPSFAQNLSITKPNTYAVIIGISKYKNEGIDKLQFAHKDAEAFANYLKSNAGGKVSDSNIVLLQNEKATYTAIYQALDWLLEVCKEGDLVYFFFSGHGDMENNTIYKLGFLISYNTPRNNYINNAVRIEDINNYANTLSVKTKAKVIMVTDACHSGNLTGSDFKGGFLVGEQLRTVQNNEIRLASCATDQLSAEDKKWGGGSGVFTYYLIDGLKGLADSGKDGAVTVKELSNYLKSSLERDPVLKSRKHVQTPVVKGNEIFAMSKVNSSDLNRVLVRNVAMETPPLMDLAPLPKDLSSYFFDLVASREIEQMFDFIALSKLEPSEIVHAMQRDTIFLNRAMEANRYAPPNNPLYDTAKLSEYARQLKSNPYALKRCQKKLVELISNRGQEIINLYLEGNAEEIERRRYYNSVKNEYGQYAKMFEVAMKLCDAKSPLAKILAIKYHYFSSVALRIGLFIAKDTTGILDRAYAEILKAYELEDNAAYIHTELGNFHCMKERYAEAEKSYQKAIDIAPTWVIPWSAMASLAIVKKNYDQALKILAKVDSLQKDYQPGLVNASTVFMQKKNWLIAEELNRKAIHLNSRHYLPFEKLGFVYTATTQYALADSFFYEAEIRKLGYNLRDVRIDGPLFEETKLVKIDPIRCIVPSKLNENDVMSFFIKGRLFLQEKDDSAAEMAFRKVIDIDKSNPLAFHYLGKMKWRQKKMAGSRNISYLCHSVLFGLGSV